MFSIAIHGGAGTILPTELNPEIEARYRASLEAILQAGWLVLEKGGTAIDAVTEAVCVMENDPLFNAGRGAVFTAQGTHELDASLMRGDTLASGAVAGVTGVKNPVRLARMVMENTSHVLLAGAGANAFALEMGVEMMPDSYFFSQLRWDQWQQVRGTTHTLLDHTPEVDVKNALNEKKFGTGGAVAFDMHGNLAAATSTGGMTNKKYGRVGDTPLIGAGTWAHNATAAISCTGDGEYFIRAAAAHDVHCLMQYKGHTLAEAVDLVVNTKLVALGGEGGMIAVDGQGNMVMDMNTPGMYRACRKAGDDLPTVAIFR